MIFYALLTAATLIIAALGWALWKTTRSLAFLFGLAALYFWSLYGSWSIVTDQLGGDSARNYHYLFEKMFPVYLDSDYFWTLVLYSLFMIVVATTVFFAVEPAHFPNKSLTPIRLSHDRIILIGCVSAYLSYYIMQESLGHAFQLGKSAYHVTRLETADLGLFRIHQILNRVALVPSAIGMAVLLSSGPCRLMTGVRRLRHYVGYTLLLGFMFCYCVVLGNKNELAFALFAGCLLYPTNSTRPRSRQLAFCGALLLACVGLVDHFRSASLDEMSDRVSFGALAGSLQHIAESNEAFAAHMSLYGSMIYDVPLTYGSSIYCFLVSAVPRIFWPNRPDDIYWYYASNVGAVAIADGQGYTIHHAAGWYLNFGTAGLIFGAFLLGRIWAALFNNVVRASRQSTQRWWRVFCVIGFFTFTASIPSVVRSGPEIYKSVLVEAFFIPVAVLCLARTGRHAPRRVDVASPVPIDRLPPSRREHRVAFWLSPGINRGR